MKKKTKVKGYFAGGVAMAAQLATNSVNNYMDAASYQFDPKKDPYKIDPMMALKGGAIGLIPELIKAQKDKQQRASHVMYATPGNYAQGGPLVPKITQSESTQTAKYKEQGADSSGRKVLRRGMKEDVPGEITQLQQFLLNKGFYTGKTDGIYGPKTEAAVKKYQKYFNEEAKERMFYTKGTDKPGLIGKGAEKIAEDGIVGDQTRTALMYRERPVETRKKKDTGLPEDIEFPVGQQQVKYQTSDYTPNNFPDSPMNYMGGLEMLSAAALVPELAGAGAAVGTAVGAQGASGAATNLLSSGVRMNLPQKMNVLGNTVPQTTSRIGSRAFGPKTPSGYGTRVGYASGGQMEDTGLSGSSFQVKGNPNVTDGNYYPEINANLDHNEVVKGNFVFSEKLKDPTNNVSFAKQAYKIEKSTGNAQKKLLTNPNDTAAKNTIKMNELNVTALGKLQETVATAKGLRKPTRNFTVGGDFTGGPGDRIYIGYDNIYGDLYWDKQMKSFVTPKGEVIRKEIMSTERFNKFTEKLPLEESNPINMEKKYGFLPADMESSLSPKQWREIGKEMTNNKERFNVPGREAYGPSDEYDLSTVESTPEDEAFWARSRSRNALRDGSQLTVTSGRPNMTSPTQPPETVPTGAFPYPQTEEPVTTNNTPRTDGRNKAPVKKPLNEWEKLKKSLSELPPKTYDPNAVPSQAEVLAQLGDSPSRAKPTNRLDHLGPLISPEIDSRNMSMDPVNAPVAKTNITRSNDIPFTIGDGLQALKVGSQFAQTLGGAEVETPNYDTTAITKENYDPSNALYQTNRNFQNASNTIDASSINTKRNIRNSLFAQRLGQDNITLTSYDQMNQGARTQFQQRTADQRRYNIGQTTYTNDINARNRSAYKEAVDTAFTSLGNFGKGLNEKTKASASLNVLKTMYPDVYARILQSQAQSKT